MALTNEQMKTMYLNMQRGHIFETEAKRLAGLMKVQGFIHLSIGQEAAAAGSMMALREDDYMTGTHRSHTHLICRGAEPKLMMTELFGKEAGYCKGKGGSIHIADATRGILGANGIIGANFPIAVGAALSAKMRNSGQICLCCFGDGSTNEGAFHEALGLASIWNLPVVFFCENNGWQITTPFSYHTKVENVADRTSSYGIPSVIIDGNDPVAVYEAVSEAVEKARAGEGPTLIEAKTYRLEGHFVGDQAAYRDKAEEAEALKREPIARFAKVLIEKGICTEEDIAALDKAAADDIAAAIEFADSQPPVSVENTLTDVFAGGFIEEGRNR